MRLVPHAELSGNDLQTHYVAPDSSTRLVGITLEPDARTKIGVIIGIQDTEPPTDVTSQNRCGRLPGISKEDLTHG
jgi:hypothetical protein